MNHDEIRLRAEPMARAQAWIFFVSPSLIIFDTLEFVRPIVVLIVGLGLFSAFIIVGIEFLRPARLPGCGALLWVIAVWLGFPLALVSAGMADARELLLQGPVWTLVALAFWMASGIVLLYAISYAAHWHTLMHFVRAQKPQTFVEFLLAATGSKTLSLREYFSSSRAFVMPKAYECVVGIGAWFALVAISAPWMDFAFRDGPYALMFAASLLTGTVAWVGIMVVSYKRLDKPV